ncbi:MAG: DNA/RNA helicase domain-containing protein [Gemmatimonadota bacterium]|nr:DNA/RNA helicase domain-containing protein [Gemmatimonadota bacterium]
MPVALRRLQPFTKQGFSRSAVGLDDDEMDNMASLMESALPRKGYYCFDFQQAIEDALALRTNAYRVLLTRGRDGSTVFIPHIHGKTEETYEYLKQCGFVDLV